jgi:hypothetical protein
MAVTVAASVAVALAALTTPHAQAAGRPDVQRQVAERWGLQTVPKQLTAGKASALNASRGVNPNLALVPDPTTVDYAHWHAVMAAAGKRRAAARAALAAGAQATPILVDEQEPDGLLGGNDTPDTAQAIPEFGTASGAASSARILGTVAPPPAPLVVAPVPEDNGAIPLAGNLSLAGSGTESRVVGTVGDGPHSSAGDATGDFDFYLVSGATAGQRLLVDVDTPGSSLDSVAVVWDAAGDPIAINDDGFTGADPVDSFISVTLPDSGDFYVSVHGFGHDLVPADPFDSGSGSGVGSEGAYNLTVGLDVEDTDVYSVTLRAGDVIGASVVGSDTVLRVFDPAQREVIGSAQDLSGIYPATTPLPGGGNAVLAHVADEAGPYYVEVQGVPGNYDVTLQGFRPGPAARDVTQTIFLDFDGAQINTAPFGGPGVRTLSPLSGFLGRWGLTAADEDAVIDRVIATVTENLEQDFAGQGVRIRILNSRDDPDPFGQPDVSRLIIGGTVDESGINTIGISQSIDPGNFNTAESALILLDIVSGPSSDPASFNAYLTPASDRVLFVGTALGNIASHEAGHYLGSWHVDQFNDVANLMDAGGNFPLLFGVGPDGVGGTADDPDVDYGEDVFNLFEGFSGVEDTAANTRAALLPGP